MITKQRLEELIEQGATIYFVYNGNVDEKESVYKDDFILNETYVSIYWTTRSHQVKYENLFETKEEAEWHKEFGCIERTERLELPTWEDVSKDFISLKVATGQYPVVEFGDNSIEIIVNVNKDIRVVLWSDFIGNFVAPLTKENYTLACRKAKELFLGEK